MENTGNDAYYSNGAKFEVPSAPPPAYDEIPQAYWSTGVAQNDGFNFTNPSQPMPGSQPQLQQQPQVIIVQQQQPTTVFVQRRVVYEKYRKTRVLACFVLWFCGIWLGLIAYIFARSATKQAFLGQNVKAIKFRNASIGFSISGIVTGIAIIIVVSSSSRTTSAIIHIITANAYYCICSVTPKTNPFE